MQMAVLAATVALGGIGTVALSADRSWSAAEVSTIGSLRIRELGPVPADPSNRYADDSAAVRLGHRLFFDTRLSANGQVSCGSCHQPGRQFQDGAPLASGVGRTDRRTMPIAGTAHSPWQFWDGRKDSQWAQALGPLESPVEHGGTRAQYARVILEHYRGDYERVFGALPDLRGVPERAGPIDEPRARAAWDALTAEQREAVTRVFVNIGKAIAAYERRLEPGATRFDRYADSLVTTGHAPKGVLSADEVAGLRLFIGRASCTQCHNGPRLTDDHFHNPGVPAALALPEDRGRLSGALRVLRDEFNCRSPYSDARPEQCSELEFLIPEGETLLRAFKTPSLRGAASRAPYMHAGQIGTLAEVIAHYDQAPPAPAGRSEIRPLHLSRAERAQLEAYIRTLDAPVNAEPWLLGPPAAHTSNGGVQ
jgi:cytochrome c peroxidase